MEISNGRRFGPSPLKVILQQILSTVMVSQQKKNVNTWELEKTVIKEI